MENVGLKKPLLSGLTKNTYLLTLASLFADTSTEMLYPVLPIFLSQIVKNPAGYIGIIEGIATGTSYIIQGFSGWFSDLLGKRKLIALFGYGLSALAKPFIGIAASWPQVLAGRTFERLGSGIRSAPRDGLIAQSADEKNRGKAFGLEGIGDNLGAVIGPLFAAFLIYKFQINLRFIFVLAFIPAVLAFLATLLVSEKRQSEIAQFGVTKAPTRSHLVGLSLRKFPRAYWKYILVIALFSIGNSSNAFLILQAKNLGATVIGTILIYAAFNFVSALVSLPSGSLSDRFGRKNILLGSFLISAVTYTGFTIGTNLSLIVFLFILYGAYAGAFRTVGKSFATDFVNPDLRATAVGIYSSTIGLTGLFASIGAGYLWTTFGPWAAFALGTVSSILGSLFLIFLV